MVFMGDVFRFDDDSIGTAPEQDGVYALYQGNELIYIGKAEQGDSIKSRLQNHLSGADMCTRTATSYRYEVCDDPRHREELYLQIYKVSYLKLPRCNSRIGS